MENNPNPPRSSRERMYNILQALTEEERQMVTKFLEIEKEKLHMRRPRGIYEELMQVVKEMIR